MLASTSPYRKALLERLGLGFELAAPHVDERPLHGEAPRDTALRLAGLKAQARIVPCRVRFRMLDDARIESYLRREQPYDCAGSAKVEGLGIALIARIDTEDPTSLIGLPLIALTEMLERAGLPVL